MADSLPLIPEKGGECGDVRGVLRGVFRALGARAPPAPPSQRGDSLPALTDWTDKLRCEREEVRRCEAELKEERARRCARPELPNLYRLAAARAERAEHAEHANRALLRRPHLMPAIQQNAGRDGTLWIKNTLNASSSELRPREEAERDATWWACALPAGGAGSLQSLSVGRVREWAPPPPAAPPPAPPPPECIVCVPPRLDFVNFTVGQLHTRSVRLVNVSKFEVRLSVRPPARRELSVQLAGARGLAVTAGAAAELRVQFAPRDVRPLRDRLAVRASAGRALSVPIACYMRPPLLHVLAAAAPAVAVRCPSTAAPRAPVADVLDLGARLLGDLHHVDLLLHCPARHAAFFLLTEDDWISFSLDGLRGGGAVCSGPFAVSPAWWRGGGAVRGAAWCRAECAGLQAAPLRALASTAAARPLWLVADALQFRPTHVSLAAHAKDYDARSEDDPACEYYVHLGTAFPHRELAASVQLINHSPVAYKYYWSARPWGVCACGREERPLGAEEGSEGLCVGALEARRRDAGAAQGPETAVRVEPPRGQLVPRAARAAHVRLPDAGATLGINRTVLMLILEDIPKESFPPDYDPMIVNTEVVESGPMPGMKSWSREVCAVVCCQMEVWWEVVPVRFILDPLVVSLTYSRRVSAVQVCVRATQLTGRGGVGAAWRLPAHAAPPAPPAPRALLSPSRSLAAALHVALPDLPNDYPEVDVFEMVADNEEWSSRCTVERRCSTRHPRLRPARRWLGVVPPGRRMTTELTITNDTHQHICWWAEPYRWWGESAAGAACAAAGEPCAECRERACSCALLRPTRGALAPAATALLRYDVTAPDTDTCVATLVRASRTSADVSRAARGAGGEARAALVAYRVLAPRVLLRVLPCGGLHARGAPCEGCALDAGDPQGTSGAALLRPAAALAAGRATCCRLRVANITPLPTTVTWEPALEGEDSLKVTFIPNEFVVPGHQHVEIQVALHARRACGRRVWVRRARAAGSARALYLLVDAAVAGVEVSCEVPLGGDEHADGVLVLRRTQKEKFPWEAAAAWPPCPSEVFAHEDRCREVVQEDICRCQYKMQYVPPRPPTQLPSVEIVESPPALRRVCACCARGPSPPAPPAPAPPYCLQFVRLPLYTVWSRTVVVRNSSTVEARWAAAVRRWPRRCARALPTACEDAWRRDAGASGAGVALEVRPAAGRLPARAAAAVRLSVYADCWGLYRDQLLLQVENVEPIILDVWIEAVGAPLQFSAAGAAGDQPPVFWLSAGDPVRRARARNASRSRLHVRAYLLREHERPEQRLPLRLYVRLLDAPRATCPCVSAFDSESVAGEGGSSLDSASYSEEMDTAIELYLSEDFGLQTETGFQVEPMVCEVGAGAACAWAVRLAAAPRDPPLALATLLLRTVPLDTQGEGWYRPEPAAARVRLRFAGGGHGGHGGPQLQLSTTELRARLCALDLPHDDLLRVRKHFRVQNVGDGPLEVRARTQPPWSIAAAAAAARRSHAASCGCCAGGAAPRLHDLALLLEPRSSTEMCVEVSVPWSARPTAPPYPPRVLSTTPLLFQDEDNTLATLRLVLELECPQLQATPASIDFGFVTDGDSRKAYFTLTHSSQERTLEVRVWWEGARGFAVSPPRVRLPPGDRQRVYLLYTAGWCYGAPAEGVAHVAVVQGGAGAGAGAGAVAGAGAGAWCRAAVSARAVPARDHKCAAPPHDHTDDECLLPPDYAHFRP